MGGESCQDFEGGVIQFQAVDDIDIGRGEIFQSEVRFGRHLGSAAAMRANDPMIIPIEKTAVDGFFAEGA